MYDRTGARFSEDLASNRLTLKGQGVDQDVLVLLIFGYVRLVFDLLQTRLVACGEWKNHELQATSHTL